MVARNDAPLRYLVLALPLLFPLAWSVVRALPTGSERQSGAAACKELATLYQ